MHSGSHLMTALSVHLNISAGDHLSQLAQRTNGHPGRHSTGCVHGLAG